MKVLIIGLGSIAKKHIHALHDLGVTDIWALRSSQNSPKLEGVKNIYFYSEIEDKNFDFFLISNVTSKHSETIEKLLKFKKPFFIEKPVFEVVNETNIKLVNRLMEAKIPTYVACSLRFLDSLREVKKLVKNSRINEVNIYSGSYLPNWRPGTDFRKSYSASKELGGGVHIDLIHELDYLYWIFGKPNNTNSTFSSKSSLDISSYDYANFLWKYDHYNANVVLNYYRRDTKRTMEIITSEETFLVDLMENKILRNNEEIFYSNQKPVETYLPQMKFFLNEVVGNSKCHFNTIDEAYKILQLCLKD